MAESDDREFPVLEDIPVINLFPAYIAVQVYQNYREEDGYVTLGPTQGDPSTRVTLRFSSNDVVFGDMSFNVDVAEELYRLLHVAIDEARRNLRERIR
jgi:hypothetical protein